MKECHEIKPIVQELKAGRDDKKCHENWSYGVQAELGKYEKVQNPSSTDKNWNPVSGIRNPQCEVGKGREEKRREVKGRERKGMEGKGREEEGGKRAEEKGREGKGREKKGMEGKGMEGSLNFVIKNEVKEMTIKN